MHTVRPAFPSGGAPEQSQSRGKKGGKGTGRHKKNKKIKINKKIRKPKKKQKKKPTKKINLKKHKDPSQKNPISMWQRSK